MESGSIRIFTNATFHTMRGLETAGALAVDASGHIIDMGERRSLRARFPKAELEDLEGASVLPGITDSHIHFAGWCLQRSQCNLDGAHSLAEALDRIARHASKSSPEAWLTGTGWNWNVWSEGRLPTAADLDAITARAPAVFMSKDFHTAWLNSEAMVRLGVAAGSLDIEGGSVDRDAQGRPTGIVREAAAFVCLKQMPAPTLEAFTDAITAGQKSLARLGITAVHSMATGEEFQGLAAIDAAGTLKLRVACYLPPVMLEALAALGIASGYGTRNLKIGGIKIFADGSLGSQTAYLLEPYEGRDSRGALTISREDLTSLIGRAHGQGLACAVHAIGDATVRLVLDAYESLGRRGKGTPRHRIEHCQLVHPDDIARFGTLGIIASVQPSHCPSDMDLVETYWGARGRNAYAFKSLARAGARLVFGSDAPVEEPNPWVGIHAAVTRTRVGNPGRIFVREERLTRLAALQAYTQAPPFAVGDEKCRGTLEIGKQADFIVLSRDPFTIPADDIPGIRVLRTYVGGKSL